MQALARRIRKKRDALKGIETPPTAPVDEEEQQKAEMQKQATMGITGGSVPEAKPDVES
jgi:hypothetical protein